MSELGDVGSFPTLCESVAELEDAPHAVSAFAPSPE